MILYIGNNIKSANRTVLFQLSNLLRKEGYNVVISSSKENQFVRLIDMIFSVVRNKYRVSHVLIDTYSTKNFYYALIVSQLCRLLNLKYIPILHGGNLPERLKKSPNLSKLIFKNSFLNVAPSNYLKHEFEVFGYQVRFIPNNLEVDKYSYKVRKKIEPKLLFVRSFSKIYNPQLAVKVLGELRKEYPDAKLCMVGPDKDGTLEKCKAIASELNVTDSVLFTGKLAKEEWHKLSTEYDIFINPTNLDNTPVSVMEAMALGLPVVSTNVGGIPYLIDNGSDGFLVEPNDVMMMVDSIKNCINKPELTTAITEKARKKVEAFDWEIIKSQWLQVLR